MDLPIGRAETAISEMIRHLERATPGLGLPVLSGMDVMQRAESAVARHRGAAPARRLPVIGILRTGRMAISASDDARASSKPPGPAGRPMVQEIVSLFAMPETGRPRLRSGTGRTTAARVKSRRPLDERETAAREFDRAPRRPRSSRRAGSPHGAGPSSPSWPATRRPLAAAEPSPGDRRGSPTRSSSAQAGPVFDQPLPPPRQGVPDLPAAAGLAQSLGRLGHELAVEPAVARLP